MELLNKKIYEVPLYFVNQNVVINKENSKIENILDNTIYAYRYTKSSPNYLMMIMVEETFSKKYVKEIITGRLIPTLRINYHELAPFYYSKKIKLTRKSCAFIPVKEMKLVSPTELEKYINTHNNKDSYIDELDNIFSQAEKNYKNAINDKVNEEMNYGFQIKQLMKKI